MNERAVADPQNLPRPARVFPAHAISPDETWAGKS